MIRVRNMHKLVSLCGLVLGLLIVCNASSLTFLGESAVFGGGYWWYVTSEGDCCYSTVDLDCDHGLDYGYKNCDGGSFSGVLLGGSGYTRGYSPPRRAGCSSSPGHPESTDCYWVYESYCYFGWSC